MAEISSTGDQMLQLLELVALEGQMTTAELAIASDINRTVAHRLLTTLHNRGYVIRRGKTFAIGPKITQLAATGTMHDILEIAHPIMRELSEKIGETVVLHKIDADHALVLEQVVNEEQLIRVQHREGSRHPLHTGASGRAILAFQPAAQIKRLIVGATNPDQINDILAKVRKDGISYSENELQQGVHGAAVPLRETGGVVRYSLGILLPVQRAAGLDAAIPLLVNARDTIEASLVA